MPRSATRKTPPLYCAWQWPVFDATSARQTFAHLAAPPGAPNGLDCRRPFLPAALPDVGGCWFDRGGGVFRNHRAVGRGIAVPNGSPRARRCSVPGGVCRVSPAGREQRSRTMAETYETNRAG